MSCTLTCDSCWKHYRGQKSDPFSAPPPSRKGRLTWGDYWHWRHSAHASNRTVRSRVSSITVWLPAAVMGTWLLQLQFTASSPSHDKGVGRDAKRDRRKSIRDVPLYDISIIDSCSRAQYESIRIHSFGARTKDDPVFLRPWIQVSSRLGVLDTWVLVSRRIETEFWKSWSNNYGLGLETSLCFSLRFIFIFVEKCTKQFNCCLIKYFRPCHFSSSWANLYSQWVAHETIGWR